MKNKFTIKNNVVYAKTLAGLCKLDPLPLTNEQLIYILDEAYSWGYDSATDDISKKIKKLADKL